MLVVNVFKHICTMVVDLQDAQDQTTPIIILPKCYDQWKLDHDMDCVEEDEEVNFTFNPVTI